MTNVLPCLAKVEAHAQIDPWIFLKMPLAAKTMHDTVDRFRNNTKHIIKEGCD